MVGVIHIIIQVLTQRHERESRGCDRSVDGGGSATRRELDPNLQHLEWERVVALAVAIEITKRPAQRKTHKKDCVLLFFALNTESRWKRGRTRRVTHNYFLFILNMFNYEVEVLFFILFIICLYFVIVPFLLMMFFCLCLEVNPNSASILFFCFEHVQ